MGGVTRLTDLNDSGHSGGWQVFLSHTSELRDFPKGTSYVVEAKRCDVYAGILGTRYGSRVRDGRDVSYTELEFDTATEAGLDRLVFQLDTDADDIGIPASRLIDREFGDRQDAFRRRVRDSGLTVQLFASPAQLGQLAAMRERLVAEDKATVQVLQGMGGVGKTQLATEYAHRYAPCLTWPGGSTPSRPS